MVASFFRNKDHFKVGLFEAKWPRLSTHINYWDSIQKSTAKSHFDSQLDRQSSLTSYAVWEMFYCEEPYGANQFFPHYGSSCVWHSDAVVASSTRNQAIPWDDTELTALLSASRRSVGHVVRSILECTEGRRYPVDSMEGQLRELGVKGKVLVIDLGDANL